MDEKIYRKKSLDKVKSPESLNDYLRVSNPGVWLILAAIIALLAGACVWGIFGHVDTKIKTSAIAENGSVVCFVSAEEAQSVKKGMTVRLDDKEGTVEKVSADSGNNSCRVTVKADVPDGTYSAEIIVESVKPMSFVTN